jgi:hypothetical protein
MAEPLLMRRLPEIAFGFALASVALSCFVAVREYITGGGPFFVNALRGGALSLCILTWSLLLIARRRKKNGGR